MSSKINVEELMAKEEQLTLVKESDKMYQFKNDDERLAFVEDKNNWKKIYANSKFNCRISILTIKSFKFIRYEVLADQPSWYQKGGQRWIKDSTRRILGNNTQSLETYTDLQIVALLKQERNNL